jgi:hypothetical protein
MRSGDSATVREENAKRNQQAQGLSATVEVADRFICSLEQVFRGFRGRSQAAEREIEMMATKTKPAADKKARKQANETTGKPEAKKHAEEATGKPEAEKQTKPQGKGGRGRYDVLGFACTAVIRWMGREGWEFDQARKALTELGADCANGREQHAPTRSSLSRMPPRSPMPFSTLLLGNVFAG